MLTTAVSVLDMNERMSGGRHLDFNLIIKCTV